MIRADEKDDSKIEGIEVYDNYGGGIKILGGKSGDSYWLNEMGEDGKTVLATFEVAPINGKLVGHWKKADGSKTLGFVATMGGQQ